MSMPSITHETVSPVPVIGRCYSSLFTQVDKQPA